MKLNWTKRLVAALLALSLLLCGAGMAETQAHPVEIEALPGESQVAEMGEMDLLDPEVYVEEAPAGDDAAVPAGEPADAPAEAEPDIPAEGEAGDAGAQEDAPEPAGESAPVCAHERFHLLNHSMDVNCEPFDEWQHLERTVAYEGYPDALCVCERCGALGMLSDGQVDWDADPTLWAAGSAVEDTALRDHEFEDGVCARCGAVQPEAEPNAAPVILGVKETFALTAALLGLADAGALHFESSDAAIVSVNAASGKLTAKKVGQATVTATAEGGASATVDVIVRKAPTRVRLSRSKATLGVGETLSLTATLLPEESASAVKFTSSKKSVAQVDANGVVTALKKGTATITAKTYNGKKATCRVTVKAAPKSVTVSLSSLTLSVGQVRTPTVKLSSGSAGAWTLSSSNTSAVVVEGTSLRAVGAGTAGITANTYNGCISSSIVITVVGAPGALGLRAGGREGDDGALTLGKGEKLQLQAVPDRDAPVDIRYASSNSGVVAVSSAGKLTARKTGTAVVTATTHNDLTASLTVTVLKAPGKVRISPTKKTIHVYDELELCATLPAGSMSPISFKSSNSKVVQILESADGVCRVKALKKGTATITARTFNGKKAACKLTVKAAVLPSGLALDYDFIGVPAGGTFRLTPSVKPSGATLKTVLWQSDDESVARVEDGAVTGVAPGETTVRARMEASEDIQAVCRVKVSEAGRPVPVSDVTLEPDAATLRVGETLQLKGTALPLNAAYRAISWSSSDEGVATVGSDGLVTAIQDGECVITAQAADGSGAQATAAITVRTVTYRALLVSESQFYYPSRSRWERIKRNQADVVSMQAMLEGVQGPEGGYYTVTTRDNTTSAELKSLIASTFRGADDNDVSLFFIATHGDSSSSGSGAAALSMASFAEESAEMMRISELRDCLLAVPGKVIVILESCGSGGAIYANGTKDAQASAAKNAAETFDASVVKTFAAADPGILEEKVEIGSDEVRVNTGELRVVNKFYVLTASMFQENSYGYEGSNPGNIFTRWLVKGVGRSGYMPADRQYRGNSDGLVDLWELYSYISAVGDDYPISIQGVNYYQHVQVYPDTRYELFK